MKFSLVAGVLALATAVSAYEPYPCTLTQEQANDIVGAFAAILQNKTYNGILPVDNYKNVLSEEYTEYSDSIKSLISKNNTLGNDEPVAVGRDGWYAGVSRNPVPSITTRDLLVAGDYKIIWRWTFNGIGIARYPASGFNLFTIDENLQIVEADIEFNSIAWGVDIFEIQQYCS